jgi:hypothetical protein
MNSGIRNKTQKLIAAYFRMMVYSVITVMLAIFVAYLFNKFYPLTTFWVLFLESAGYVCWGTSLGALSSKFGPSNREDTTDLLNQKLIFCTSMLGIFVFTMAQTLQPIIK